MQVQTVHGEELASLATNLVSGADYSDKVHGLECCLELCSRSLSFDERLRLSSESFRTFEFRS